MRVTQRAPQSCIACTRRKVRCDKKIPCNQCRERNQEAQCKREVVFSQGKLQNLPPDGPSIEDINAGLIQELSRLKAENQLLKQMINENSASASRTGSDARSITVISETLAGLSLGIAPIESENESKSTASYSTNDVKVEGGIFPFVNPFADPEYEHFDLTEPGATAPPITHNVSRYIIDFHMSMISWIHCSVHRENFITEHELYWKMLAENNQLIDNEVFEDGHPFLSVCNARRYNWEALWFAILSSGLFYMGIESLKEIGLSEEAAHDKSRKFLKASLSSLHKARFMETCNVLTVQTYCVLGLVFPAFGGFDIKSSFMAVALFNCQRLHINQLGAENIDESNYSLNFNNILEKEDFVHRELARRMWWTVVIIDWLTVNIRFPYIDPDSFDTALPLNIRDEDLYNDSLTIQVLPENVDTDISYHIFLSKMAIIRRTCCIKPTFPHTGERDLLSFAEKLSQLSEHMPERLKSDYVDENESLYSVRRFQRTLLASDVQCQFLKAYRELAFGQPPAECAPEARRQCQLTAKALALEFSREHPLMFYKNYVPQLNAVQAGIFLVMDILQLDDDDPERLEELEALGGIITGMQQVENTQKTASRGIKLLRKLVSFALGPKADALPYADLLRHDGSPSGPNERGDALVQLRELALSSTPPRMSSIKNLQALQPIRLEDSSINPLVEPGSSEYGIGSRPPFYDNITDQMLEEIFFFSDPTAGDTA